MSPGELPVVRVVARHPFARIAFARDARRIVAGGLVGRFREAGTGLAIVLAVRGAAGSYAVAGTAGAAYLLAAAVSRPAHGRLVDKAGVGRGLLAASLANSLALAGLAAAVWAYGGDGLLVAAAAATGLTLPALSAALRTLWPRVITGPPDEAYAFDTLLYETSLIISPACTGLIATLASAPAALIVLACAGTLGTAIVAAAPAARTPRPATAGPGDGRLFSRLVLAVITVTLFSGFAEGSMTVIVPAFASHHRQAAAAGPLLSALSCGCLIGSLGYGVLARRGDWPARLVICACALTLASAGLAVFSQGVIVFGVLLAATGVTLAPTLTTGFVAIQQAAPPASLAEAFTWASFCASAGAAGAQALAGNLIGRLGVTTALWLPAAAAAATVAAAILTRRLYRIPGSAVTVMYASQCERDRSLRLAQARQELAERGAGQ